MIYQLFSRFKSMLPSIMNNNCDSTMNDNTNNTPLMSRLQRKMASMMGKYAIARRAILVFMMYIIYRLIDVMLKVYVTKGTIASEMVDIIGMFVTILTIFSCFYTASRFSEVSSDKIKVSSHKPDKESNNEENGE